MSSTIDVLNRLSVAHSRSLPVYLSYAGPWIPASEGRNGETLLQVAADQKRMADRIGTMLLDLGGTVDPGKFPLKYTALHDLSYEYLLGKLVENQRQTVRTIEACAADLTLAPLARSLAEEALGEARGHLEMLEELTGKAARS